MKQLSAVKVLWAFTPKMDGIETSSNLAGPKS